MNAKNELDGIRDRFLLGLETHNAYQSEKDREQAREIDEAIRQRYPAETMVRVPGTAFGETCIAHVTHLRHLTSEEKSEDQRPRARIVKAPIAPPVDDRPCICFTPVARGLITTSADAIFLDLVDEKAGTETIIHLEARRRSDIFDALDNWQIDILARPIPGRTAKAFIDTGMKDSSSRRVFARIEGPAADDPSAMYFGELRAFKAEELPEAMPENVDLQAYAAEELKKAQKAWSLRMNGPESHEDRKRREEKEAERDRIDAAVLKALEGKAVGESATMKDGRLVGV